MITSIRYWLTRMGDHMSRWQIVKLKGVLKYLETGFLMRQLGHRVNRIERFEANQRSVFDFVAGEVRDRAVLYMEFGVFQGDTTRYWSRLLRNPNSKLHGFDSFEGLPEAWGDKFPKGGLTVNGAIPVIDDPRVQFFKGWFDQSLPKYEVPEHEVLILNFDADLYSSTIYVLNHMSTYIVPGTYLYFDEFWDPEHELRAFMEFCSSSERKFALRCASTSMQSMLFLCVA